MVQALESGQGTTSSMTYRTAPIRSTVVLSTSACSTSSNTLLTAEVCDRRRVLLSVPCLTRSLQSFPSSPFMRLLRPSALPSTTTCPYSKQRYCLSPLFQPFILRDSSSCALRMSNSSGYAVSIKQASDIVQIKARKELEPLIGVVLARCSYVFKRLCDIGIGVMKGSTSLLNPYCSASLADLSSTQPTTESSTFMSPS